MIRSSCLLVLLAALMRSAPLLAEPPWVSIYNLPAPESVTNAGGHDTANILAYVPEKGPKPTSAILICPGGGYSSEVIQQEGSNAAEWFKAHGIAAFVLIYRLPRDGYHNLVPMHDGQRAIRWVRSKADQYNIDPHKIAMMGFSAGGHLASTVETHFDAGNPQAVDPVERMSCRPDLAILIYPVISMKDGETNAFCKTNLLGPNPDPTLVETLSSATQVTARTPPTILFFADDDPLVLPRNSKDMYAALQKAGVASELHEYPTGGHGWGWGATPDTGPPGWFDVTLFGWLKKNGFAE